MKIKNIVLLSMSIVLLTAGAGNNDIIQPVFANSNDHKEKDEHGHDDGKEEAGHNKEAGGHEEEAGVIKLTNVQMTEGNIEVTKLQLQAISETISAPAEIHFNDYKTVKITPRITAQVIARHAQLGEKVEKGQAVVTLSSVEMTEVQGKLLVATREWNRVKKLGRKVVAERRYTEARANWNQLLTKARSYGMTKAEVDAMIKGTREADGTFQLLAPLSGRIISDQFIIGEQIEPGRVLVTITNESVMWAEARLNPTQVALISLGNTANIAFNSHKLPATVSQFHHKLDEATRTQAIRMEVPNVNDLLHAGMFVTAFISTDTNSQAIALPEEAVVRSQDGDWEIFLEGDEKGEFKSQEVELVKVINGLAVIKGVAPGTTVVTKGAFFVQSELAKGGFSIHNH